MTFRFSMITQINAILEIYFRRDLSETDARLPDLLALNAHFSITGSDAEACWPLNGPLFSSLNPLYSHCILLWGGGDRTAAIGTGLKLENYYFFTFTFSWPEVGKLFLIYFFTFSFSWPEVGKLFLIYFFTFSRPEVGKLFRIYVFLDLNLENYSIFRWLSARLQ